MKSIQANLFRKVPKNGTKKTRPTTFPRGFNFTKKLPPKTSVNHWPLQAIRSSLYNQTNPQHI